MLINFWNLSKLFIPKLFSGNGGIRITKENLLFFPKNPNFLSSNTSFQSYAVDKKFSKISQSFPFEKLRKEYKIKRANTRYIKRIWDTGYINTTRSHKSSVDQTDRNKICFHDRSFMYRVAKFRQGGESLNIQAFRYIMLIRREMKRREKERERSISSLLNRCSTLTWNETRKHVARYKQSLIETLLSPLIYGIH